MKQPRHLIVQAIAEKTLKESDMKRVASEVAAYVLSEGRVADLEPIMRDVIAYRANKGIVEAELVSAHEVSGAVIADAKKLLKQLYPDARTVQVVSTVRPELVGGVRVRMPHEQLDLTVRSTLSTFKNRVMSGKEV